MSGPPPAIGGPSTPSPDSDRTRIEFAPGEYVITQADLGRIGYPAARAFIARLNGNG